MVFDYSLLFGIICLSLFYQECLKVGNIFHSFKFILIGLEVSENKWLQYLGKILGNCILCSTFHLTWVILLIHYIFPFYLNVFLFCSSSSFIAHTLNNYLNKKESNESFDDDKYNY